MGHEGQESQSSLPIHIGAETTALEAAPAPDAASLVERFLEEADIARSTKETYRKALRQFFSWYEGQGGGDLSRADILRYKQAKLSQIQASSVGAYLSALKSFFRWMEAEKIYPNVASGVKGVRLSQGHRKDALTPEQVRRVLDVLRGDDEGARRDFAMFNLLVRTGLRTVELHRANVEDIRNKGAQTVLYVQGKGRDHKDEFVVLTDATLRPLYAYLSMRADQRPGAPLFASMSNKSYGKRLSIRSIRDVVKGALVAAGYRSDRLTAHSLRHTAVTLSLLGGASIQQAQALARHRSIVTTTVYAHNIDRVNNAPERLVDDMLE